MNSTTAANHLSRFLASLGDIHSKIESYGSTVDYLIAEEKRLIYDDPAYKRLPRHTQNYLAGYSSAKFHETQRKVKWVHVWEGVAYDSWDALPEAGKQFLRTHSCDETHQVSMHVWPKFLPRIKQFSSPFDKKEQNEKAA